MSLLGGMTKQTLRRNVDEVASPRRLALYPLAMTNWLFTIHSTHPNIPPLFYNAESQLILPPNWRS
jgi:hypothetical protein